MEKTISGDKRENPTQSRKQISSEIAISIAKNRVHSKLGFEFGNFEFFRFNGKDDWYKINEYHMVDFFSHQFAKSTIS